MTLLLGACDGDSVSQSAASATKVEGFCAIDGLAPALRETTIVIDTSAIAAAAPEQFHARNPALFALLLGLGDPVQTEQSGAAAPRERVTVLAASTARGSATPIFTGCLPNVSPEEVAARRAAGTDTGLDRYFGQDMGSSVKKAQDNFRRELLVSLMSLSKLAEASGAAAGPDPAALPRLLKLVGAPAADGPVRRLFVFSELGVGRAFPAGLSDTRQARLAGFEAARKAQLNLGRADVFIVPSSGQPDEQAQQYLKTFVLGSSGNLLGAHAFSANGLPAPPHTIAVYRGELPASPQIRMPLEVRVATTAGGQLVSSWVSYTGSFGQRSTPLTGQFQCAGPGACALRSDPAGGFGQMWSPSAAAEPEPLPAGPFGGLRYVEAQGTETQLRMRIYDPVIFLAEAGEGGDLRFDIKRISRRG